MFTSLEGRDQTRKLAGVACKAFHHDAALVLRTGENKLATRGHFKPDLAKIRWRTDKHGCRPACGFTRLKRSNRNGLPKPTAALFRRHRNRTVEQGPCAGLPHHERPDTAHGHNLTIQHGDTADLRQGVGEFAQALGRLGEVARTERDIEQRLDGNGVESRCFRNDFKHGERV